MRLGKTIFVCALAAGLSVASAYASTIYWSNYRSDASGEIYLLDSTTLSSGTAITGVERGYRLAFDEVSGQVYWTTVAGSGIYRAGVDGRGLELVLPITGASTQGIDVVHDAGRFYYTQGGTLRAADLDGSNDVLIYDAGATQLQDVKYNPADGRLYVTEWDGTPSSTGSILAIELSGDSVASVDTLVSGLVNGPVSLDLDVANGQMYFVGYGMDERVGGLYRANLDGTGLTTLLSDVDGESLALDLDEGRIYWVTPNQSLTGGEIHRVNLDGTGYENITLPAGAIPVGIAVVPEPASLVLLVIGGALLARRR